MYPDISYYAPNEMNSNEAAEIKVWHRQQHDKVFNFRREMVDYCLQDVRILLSAVQVAVREDLDLMDFDGMAECCTIASKTMMFFRHGFLKDNTIGVISQTGIAGRSNHSYEGLLWLLLQEINYPGLQHALSTQGEKVLLKAPVDGFHEATNTVFQFHGCFWHGCPKCYRDRAAKNTVNGETFDALYTKTVRRTQILRIAGFHVIEKWACDFSLEDRQQASELGLDSKVPQLVPKDAFYGGRTEAIHLRTTLSEEEVANGTEILYYDVTSEYPYVNSRKEYPVGHPIILLKHQLPQTNEAWQRRGLFGVALCTIVPPARLIHPLLPFRHQGALIFPLCYKCCIEKRENFCGHKEEERALAGTWTTVEIDKAIELGYRLAEVKEVWHFKKRSTALFSDFINALYKGKLEASGFPDNVTTTEEKLNYIGEIRQHEGIELDIDKIAKNPGRRQMCKILLNSFW